MKPPTVPPIAAASPTDNPEYPPPGDVGCWVSFPGEDDEVVDAWAEEGAEDDPSDVGILLDEGVSTVILGCDGIEGEDEDTLERKDRLSARANVAT